MYAHLKSATELQLIIAVLSLFHMFAPYIVSVLWSNCVRARGMYRSSLAFERVFRDETICTDSKSSHIYSGAGPFTDLNTSSAFLYLTRSGSDSQRSCSKSDALGVL